MIFTWTTVYTSNAREVLRLLRNVTSVTPRNLTIPCTYHENRTSTPQNPHKVLHLLRRVIISSHVSFNNIISCKLQQNLHHTIHLEWFRPVLTTLLSTKIAISAAQIPMARPHLTPQRHHSPNVNPNGTVTLTTLTTYKTWQETAKLTLRIRLKQTWP